MEKPAITHTGKTVHHSLALADGLDKYTGEWTITEAVHLFSGQRSSAFARASEDKDDQRSKKNPPTNI